MLWVANKSAPRVHHCTFYLPVFRVCRPRKFVECRLATICYFNFHPSPHPRSWGGGGYAAERHVNLVIDIIRWQRGKLCRERQENIGLILTGFITPAGWQPARGSYPSTGVRYKSGKALYFLQCVRLRTSDIMGHIRKSQTENCKARESVWKQHWLIFVPNCHSCTYCESSAQETLWLGSYDWLQSRMGHLQLLLKLSDEKSDSQAKNMCSKWWKMVYLKKYPCSLF